jgi:hypothetical protein
LSIFVCPPVFSNVDFSPEYPFFPTCAESKINIFLLIYQIRTTTGTKYYKCRGTAYNSESFEFIPGFNQGSCFPLSVFDVQYLFIVCVRVFYFFFFFGCCHGFIFIYWFIDFDHVLVSSDLNKRTYVMSIWSQYLLITNIQAQLNISPSDKI